MQKSACWALALLLLRAGRHRMQWSLRGEKSPLVAINTRISEAAQDAPPAPPRPRSPRPERRSASRAKAFMAAIMPAAGEEAQATEGEGRGDGEEGDEPAARPTRRSGPMGNRRKSG